MLNSNFDKERLDSYEKIKLQFSQLRSISENQIICIIDDGNINTEETNKNTNTSTNTTSNSTTGSVKNNNNMSMSEKFKSLSKKNKKNHKIYKMDKVTLDVMNYLLKVLYYYIIVIIIIII